MTIAPTLEERIDSVYGLFHRVCDQLRILNRRICEIQRRYDVAERNQRKSVRYSIRIQLCVMEGVRNMHYEYALKLADSLDMLRTRAGFIVIGAHLQGSEVM